jgi:hypothetical protein
LQDAARKTISTKFLNEVFAMNERTHRNWQYVFRIAAYAEVRNLNLMPHFAYLWGGNVLDLLISISTISLVLLSVLDAANSLSGQYALAEDSR